MHRGAAVGGGGALGRWHRLGAGAARRAGRAARVPLAGSFSLFGNDDFARGAKALPGHPRKRCETQSRSYRVRTRSSRTRTRTRTRALVPRRRAAAAEVRRTGSDCRHRPVLIPRVLPSTAWSHKRARSSAGKRRGLGACVTLLLQNSQRIRCRRSLFCTLRSPSTAAAPALPRSRCLSCARNWSSHGRCRRSRTRADSRTSTRADTRTRTRPNNVSAHARTHSRDGCTSLGALMRSRHGLAMKPAREPSVTGDPASSVYRQPL